MTSDETVPNAYVPGPLTPAELVAVLRTSVLVLHSDRGHDVFTYFDILTQDHLPELSSDACHQVARTVLKHLTGIGAMETQEPIRALHHWHQRNRQPAGTVTVASTLERAFSDTVRTFAEASPAQPVEPSALSAGPQGKARKASARRPGR